MFKKITGLMIVLSTVSTAALASNINEVLSYTYENSSTISAQRTGLKAIDENVSKAKAGYRPSLVGSGSVGRSYIKNEYDSQSASPVQEKYQDPASLSVSFIQPVFSGLSTYNAVEASKQQVKAERENLANTEQSILLDAAAVYMDVLRDRAVLELQINNEKVLKEHLDSYKKRFEAGELTRTDVAQSEARLSGATAARIAAEGNLKVSNANFTDVTGLDPKKVVKDVTASSIDLPKTLKEALNLAQNKNPQIKAIDYAQKAAEKTVSAKKGALSPSVDVRATASKGQENNLTRRNDTWQVTANMTVPLYQSGAEYADIRQAKHTANQYRILARKIRSDVEAETIRAWENYTATKAQIKSIKSQIKASKIALDGVIREAKVGSRTVLDVLDAEQEHLDNQVTLVKTHRDEIVAAYSLLMATGKMNPTDLKLAVASYDPTVYYESVKNKWFGYSTDY